VAFIPDGRNEVVVIHSSAGHEFYEFIEKFTLKPQNLINEYLSGTPVNNNKNSLNHIKHYSSCNSKRASLTNRNTLGRILGK
jgi:hypothetical protein